MFNMSPLFHRSRLFFLFVFDLRWRFVAQDSPLAITGTSSILPGGVETYHLPLARGAVLNIEINAEAPLQIRLLDEETWRAAGTLDARLNARGHFDVCGRIAQLQFVAPSSCGYMLLLWNPAMTTNDALVALSSGLPRFRGTDESANSTRASSHAFAALARLFSFLD